MDLNLTAEKVEVERNTQYDVQVYLKDVSETEILQHFTIAEIISELGIEGFLKEIGEDEARKYFDIPESE